MDGCQSFFGHLVNDPLAVNLIFFEQRGLLPHHVEFHDPVIDFLDEFVSLLFIGDACQKFLHLMDLLLFKDFRRKAICILQNLVSDAEVFWDMTFILQRKRFAPAGQIIEFSFFLGFSDSLFHDSLIAG